MSIYAQMLEIRRQAAHAHCRVKRWKMTEDQALALAEQCSGPPPFARTTPHFLYAMIVEGEPVLGAPVEVR